MILADKKCHFLEQEVKFLGHLVSGEGLRMDPEKQRCVKEWPEPSNVRELRGFLGFATYYRRFIRGYSDIVEPLNRLLRKEGDYIFGEEQKESMRSILHKLTTDVMLNHPNMDKPFILDTDASDVGIGAVLSQEIEGIEKVVAYYSKSLSQQERNYCTTRKEMLALVKAVKNFRYYLLGKHFIARTDHSALQWLTSFKEPEGQVARWLEQLQEYDFQVRHRKGVAHSNADALSRRPCLMENCQSCLKKEARWGVRQLVLDIDWAEVQSVDVDITSVSSKFANSVDRPSKQDMGTMSWTVLQLWRQWESLEFCEGILYRRRHRKLSQNRQLVVPKKCRLSILEELHGGRTSGHFGAERTFQALKSRFYWPGYRKSVEVHCAGCLPCLGRNHPGKSSVPPLGLRVVGYPFERIAVDIMGPLRLSERGNKYILVVGDYFTKWVEAYPIADQEASTVGRVLCEEFISRYGVPSELHSDQGRNFESTLIREMCAMLGIKKTRTTPFRP